VRIGECNYGNHCLSNLFQEISGELKAVEVLMTALKEHPAKKTARPPHPDDHKTPPNPAGVKKH
jgi:hypothetical protein